MATDSLAAVQRLVAAADALAAEAQAELASGFPQNPSPEELAAAERIRRRAAAFRSHLEQLRRTLDRPLSSTSDHP